MNHIELWLFLAVVLVFAVNWISNTGPETRRGYCPICNRPGYLSYTGKERHRKGIMTEDCYDDEWLCRNCGHQEWVPRSFVGV